MKTYVFAGSILPVDDLFAHIFYKFRGYAADYTGLGIFQTNEDLKDEIKLHLDFIRELSNERCLLFTEEVDADKLLKFKYLSFPEPHHRQFYEYPWVSESASYSPHVSCYILLDVNKFL